MIGRISSMISDTQTSELQFEGGLSTDYHGPMSLLSLELVFFENLTSKFNEQAKSMIFLGS